MPKLGEGRWGRPRCDKELRQARQATGRWLQDLFKRSDRFLVR